MSDLHMDVKRKPTSVEEFRIWMKAKFGYDEKSNNLWHL